MKVVRIELTDGRTKEFPSQYAYGTVYMEQLKNRDEFVQVGEHVIRKSLINAIFIDDVPEKEGEEETAK